MSHLFLHVVGVDINLWVCSNEPSEQPSELLLGSNIWTSEYFFWVPFFYGCTLCWTFWCSSTLWTLWRLFIYFLQKLLEAYKWDI